jgi:hypothetical protein
VNPLARRRSQAVVVGSPSRSAILDAAGVVEEILGFVELDGLTIRSAPMRAH